MDPLAHVSVKIRCNIAVFYVKQGWNVCPVIITRENTRTGRNDVVKTHEWIIKILYHVTSILKVWFSCTVFCFTPSLSIPWLVSPEATTERRVNKNLAGSRLLGLSICYSQKPKKGASYQNRNRVSKVPVRAQQFVKQTMLHTVKKKHFTRWDVIFIFFLQWK